jgi:hypothetical protein
LQRELDGPAARSGVAEDHGQSSRPQIKILFRAHDLFDQEIELVLGANVDERLLEERNSFVQTGGLQDPDLRQHETPGPARL